MDTTNLPFAIGENLSSAFSVNFNPQSAGDKNATLVISYGSVDFEVALSGYAYPAHYNFEGFEAASFPPVGWANPGSWEQGSLAYFDGTRSAHRQGSNSTSYILSTPKLNLESGGHLSFMARIGSISAALDIVYSTDRLNWTKLGSSIRASTANTWFPVSVNLSAIPAPAGAYIISVCVQ